MRRVFNIIVPVVVLPVVFCAMLSYPMVREQIRERSPLLTAYDLSRQLASQITYVESMNYGVPTNYGDIIKEYRGLVDNAKLMSFRDLSASTVQWPLFRRKLAGLVLWMQDLPPDMLEVDPVGDIIRHVQEVQEKQRLMDARRRDVMTAHLLGCLKHQPPDPTPFSQVRRGLPPSVAGTDLIFCGEPIPISRKDVRRRIEYQIDYLLTDFFETTGIWLKRRDRYGGVVQDILLQEGLPKEFCLIPALESGYRSGVVSPSKAMGWWQFVKPTALNSRSRREDLDWSLEVNQWRDDRKDLSASTRSAARYLKWIRSRLSDESRPGSWLMAAAAYNAGLTEIGYRTKAYKTGSYWDIKLPRETEDYVPRWIALHIIDTNREFYGIEIGDIHPIEFDTLENIRLTRDLPLRILAALTGCSVRFMREINRALLGRDRCFKAKGDGRKIGHTIHVPKGCSSSVLNYLKTEAYLESGT